MAPHFVAVWNPLYAPDAMDQHLAVLLGLRGQVDAGKLDADSLYVWWGKVRSPNRQAPLPHLKQLAELAGSLDPEDAEETHLYLTDYRSLYVADVDRIVVADRLPAEEARHLPEYYGREGMVCDCWFRLRDIRRLVADDLIAVAHELTRLRNSNYHGRPVSLYGGMVDLPLVCTRDDGTTFFGDEERAAIAGDMLWAEFDREQGSGVAGMEKELREHRFGENLWFALEPSARLFIANGEWLYRNHASDPAFDFGPVLTSYAKALEVQGNALLRRVAGKLSAPARHATVDGESLDLARCRSLSLGELARVIGDDRQRNQELGRLVRQGKWFAETFPVVLAEFAKVRNPGSHTERTSRAVARKWRERLVGVGCRGDLVELAAC